MKAEGGGVLLGGQWEGAVLGCVHVRRTRPCQVTRVSWKPNWRYLGWARGGEGAGGYTTACCACLLAVPACLPACPCLRVETKLIALSFGPGRIVISDLLLWLLLLRVWWSRLVFLFFLFRGRTENRCFVEQIKSQLFEFIKQFAVGTPSGEGQQTGGLTSDLVRG